MKKKLLSMEEWKKNCREEIEEQTCDQILQMIQNGCTLADIQAFAEEGKRQSALRKEASSR